MTVTSPIAIVLDTRPLGLVTQRPGHAGGDALIATQANLLNPGAFGLSATVTAANIGHLSALTNAVLWSEIRP